MKWLVPILLLCLAAAPASQPATTQSSKAFAEKAIKEIIKGGILSSVGPGEGDTVKVVVKPGYYKTSFEFKKKIVAAILIYYEDAPGYIEFTDKYSGKVVADWGKTTGFEVK